MINVGLGGTNVQSAATPVPASARSRPDPADVNQFNSLMQPPQTAALDGPLGKLPESEQSRLRDQWGADEAGLQADAQVLVDLREKVVVDAIMKAIRKAGERERDRD